MIVSDAGPYHVYFIVLWCLVKGPTWLEKLSALAFKPVEVLCVLIFEAFQPIRALLYSVIGSGKNDQFILHKDCLSEFNIIYSLWF